MNTRVSAERSEALVAVPIATEVEHLEGRHRLREIRCIGTRVREGREALIADLVAVEVQLLQVRQGGAELSPRSVCRQTAKRGREGGGVW